MRDRVVLVTGAAGKLGTALCRSLLAGNAVVAAYHDHVPEIPSQLAWPAAGTSEQSSSRAWCVQADLNRQDDVRRLVEVCLAKHGQVDVLVNAAADISYRGRLTELWYAPEAASHQIAINTIAPFVLVSAIFHDFWKDDRQGNEQQNRNIINLSSFSGMYVQGTRGQAFYGASKAALNLLTLHLALELAPYAIRVNALCPSRFPDSLPTSAVVAAIEEIMHGSQTGDIVELSPARPTRGEVKAA